MWRTKENPRHNAGGFLNLKGMLSTMNTQLIKPNPDIPCKPGWCLAYVNEAFRVPKRFPTAMSAWLNSETQHRDYGFPDDVWVPLWFSLKNEPAGHVVLRAPGGAVYSTTHPTSNVPTKHPNLEHLMMSYSYYNPLTYLGWTEDVEGTYVITLEDDFMAMTPEKENEFWRVLSEIHTAAVSLPGQREPFEYWTHIGNAVARIDTASADSIVQSIPDNLAQQVLDGLVARLVNK